MSELSTSFTFRLTDDDKAALAVLAARIDCDRGEVLRRLIRSSRHLTPGQKGHFVANGRVYQVRLQAAEPMT